MRLLGRLFQFAFVDSLILGKVPIAGHSIDACGLELSYEFVFEVTPHADVPRGSANNDSPERTRGISRIAPFADNWSSRSRATTKDERDKDNDEDV
jgi:hypothetical protein